MHIERLSTDRTIPYIPEFAGERAKADADPNYQPVVMHLRPMSVAQFERSGEIFRTENDAIGFRLREDREDAVFVEHVARVENLQFADGTPIENGEQFAASRKAATSALAPLYLEVLAAIRDLSILREGERKNS
ncbi:MAG: hypothetical protein H6684_15970 [Deltaproteobacteria bacterium]|nr:hypothetical protein [Deltaproteobacteria bacterium]MCB9490228.1 hypothetical protein [Deltaproteobacteria bacterium]